jgi:transcriptional regulator of acetoin/glycerol metabolism
MTLEEARAVRVLCDRISALFAVSSALARSRERELDATGRAAGLEVERLRLEHIISLSSGRHRTFAELVARPVLCAAYSPAARFALEAVTRLGKGEEPIAFVAPPGVSAAAWGAIAHLSRAGSVGPLVVVDGASGSEHDPERWDDAERSPIALADGGTLVVLDVASLPEKIQDRLALSIGRRGRSLRTSQVPEARLVVSMREPAEALARTGRLSKALASELASSVALPPLSARAEDIRGMVLERLAGAGMRRRGEPLGISPHALAFLVEHDWPGNDSELADVLLRAAEVASGPVVTAQDLLAVGFKRPGDAPPAPAVPPESRRRRSSRPRRSVRSG